MKKKMHSMSEMTIQKRTLPANHLLYKIKTGSNSNVGAIEPLAANSIKVHFHIPVYL